MKKIFTGKNKIWKVMKICAAQGMMAVLLYGVCIAHNDYGQVLDRKISLDLRAVPLEEALKRIEIAAEIRFVYSADNLELEALVSINSSGITLRETLDNLLAPLSIQFKVHELEATITLNRSIKTEIRKDESRQRRGNSNELMIVTGKVTDAHQQPIAGVNVIIKGTTTGTTTDAEGKYAISAEGNEVLVFSFIGYKTYEVFLSSRSSIDVTMEEDVTSLKEVVVNAGYWKVADREMTGNIGRLSADDIQRQPVGNPMAAMQGRIAGVYVQQTSGVPGGNFNVQIRGRNSLRNDANYPLYLVDGVPFNPTPMGSTFSNSIIGGGSPFNTLNASDIESIEILKDADATAIYGSRGANGVVLITTKKGESGKTRMDLNIYTGSGRVSNKLNLLNTQQYLTMRKEAFLNDGIAPTIANATDLLRWDTTRYTDWQNELIGGTSHLTNAQISFSGGAQGTHFLFGGGYYRESTVFPGDFHDEKFSSHLHLSHQSPDQKFKFDLTTNFVFDRNRLLFQDLTSQSLTIAPVAPPIYDDAGNLNWTNGFQNPYSAMLQKFKLNTSNLLANGVIGYEISPGLQIKSNLGFNSILLKENVTFPVPSYNPSTGVTQGSATFGDRNINTWIVEPQMDYQRKFGQGTLSALAGSTFQVSLQNGLTFYGTGFTSDALLENLQAASSSFIVASDNTQYKYHAVFGRLNYTMSERYIFNLTARRDGSSRFGPKNAFANFGAVGAAWIFSKESFIRNLGPLSFGKLRASIGATGSDQIGDYQYMDTYSPSPFPYQGKAGLYPTRLANSDYGWETNKKAEAGIELAFMKDRVSLSSSYYQNLSSNQLVGYPLSVVTGFSSIQYNLPAKVQNRGWEFEFNSVNVLRGKFEWNTSINFTRPRNKLVEYPEIDRSTYANTYVVGKSLYTQKRFHYLGVDPQSGIYTYEDVDGNGVGWDFPADLQGLKQVALNYYGGVNNNFKYQDFELTLFIQFVKQTGREYFTGFSVPGAMNNQLNIVMDRWQQPGDDTQIQKFTTGAGNPGRAYSVISGNADNNIVDASFLRFKNVSLSWKLPAKWNVPLRISNCKLYLQGQNLLTITSYKGLDPETQSNSVVPPIRMITAGIQIGL